MEKIVIIGSPGAGKSTLARELGEILDIEVIHLDRHFWNSNWHEIPRFERVKIQDGLIKKPKWIIEGTYLDSSDSRLKAADTIIFLDMPPLLCLWRVLKRRVKDHNQTRFDLPEGCVERIRLPYFAKVLVFPFKGRLLFKRKIGKLLQSRDIEYLWLQSDDDISSFLNSKRGTPLIQYDLTPNWGFVLLSKITAVIATLLKNGGEVLGEFENNAPLPLQAPQHRFIHQTD